MDDNQSEITLGGSTMRPNPALSRSPTLVGTFMPLSHVPTNPDPSYPSGTTEVERVGMTDEYRVASPTGLTALPAATAEAISKLTDLEKGRDLKDVELVVWKENDPEDPRNWSKLYRWCMYFHVDVPSCANLSFLKTSLL